MSNADLVRRIYDAWNGDDWPAARQLLHPEIEWRPSGRFPGFDPLYRGHDGVRKFWDTMMEAWERFTIEIERVVESEPLVVTDVRFEALGRGSGARAELPFAHLWEFRDGLVVRYRSFPSFEEAAAAAAIEP